MSVFGVTDLCRRRLLLGGASVAMAKHAAAQPPRPTVGVWLRISDTSEVPRALDLLRERNAPFIRKGRVAPWCGVVFEQTWGQVELAAGRWSTDAILRVLDTMAAAGLWAVIQVSDKEWQYRAADDRYAAPVPADLDQGPIARADFARCTDGLCQDRYRYATLQDDTQKGRPGDAVRKYVAKRWQLESRWIDMWRALGLRFGTHRSLYAVLSPESALALPSGRFLSSVGYPGSEWYGGYLLRQALAMRDAFPLPVQVVSNINVVPPDNPRALPPVVHRLATQNMSIWAQDLNPSGQAYRTLYPLMERFPVQRRWAMVTNTTSLAPRSMVEFANELGIGHLAFLHAGFAEQVRAVEALAGTPASFLPVN